MDHPIWIAVGVLHLLAIADVWFSRMTRAARVMWTVNLVFLFGVGMAAWLLTRHTAHQELEDLPPGASDVTGGLT